MALCLREAIDMKHYSVRSLTLLSDLLFDKDAEVRAGAKQAAVILA